MVLLRRPRQPLEAQRDHNAQLSTEGMAAPVLLSQQTSCNNVIHSKTRIMLCFSDLAIIEVVALGCHGANTFFYVLKCGNLPAENKQ